VCPVQVHLAHWCITGCSTVVAYHKKDTPSSPSGKDHFLYWLHQKTKTQNEVSSLTFFIELDYDLPVNGTKYKTQPRGLYRVLS